MLVVGNAFIHSFVEQKPPTMAKHDAGTSRQQFTEQTSLVEFTVYQGGQIIISMHSR